LLRQARFTELEGENSFLADAFSKKIFQQKEIFVSDENLGCALSSCPFPCHDTTVHVFVKISNGDVHKLNSVG